MSYADFLTGKKIVVEATGHYVAPEKLHPAMRDHQRALTRWALRKGRAAIFADTGLGKTLMQLEWARHAARRALILAPLSVARQTVTEGERWGIPVAYARSQAAAPAEGITITNYEMLDRFDPAEFGAVVLDESSILKNFEGKTRTELIEACAETPYRLCCTATPAPNDITEIANHAEFLGAMSRLHMLAHWFVHDGDGWRLKKHATESFYRWMASWGMSVKRPSDLGYSDDGYDLPPLRILPTFVPSGLSTVIQGVGDRARVRKATLGKRVAAAVDLVAAEPNEQWIVWCGLNDESDALAAAIPGAVAVEGSQSPDEKAARLEAFGRGATRVLVTKPAIAGFGLNFQLCARMAFVGLSDSYESYYQAIRRCWRYGQTRPVEAHVVLTDAEKPVYDNVVAKEVEADGLSRQLVQHVAEFEREEITAMGGPVFAYEPTQPMRLPDWLKEVV